METGRVPVVSWVYPSCPGKGISLTSISEIVRVNEIFLNKGHTFY